VVTLLSIVYSDASDIGFGGYNESCQSIVYSDASDIGLNLCHRHHYIQYSTM
jgi:hypothetical protein